MPGNIDNHAVNVKSGLVHAPSEAVTKLKAEMTKPEFRTLLQNNPQLALNQVGILVDNHTALSIKNQLAGAHGINPNAIITVTAIA